MISGCGGTEVLTTDRTRNGAPRERGSGELSSTRGNLDDLVALWYEQYSRSLVDDRAFWRGSALVVAEAGKHQPTRGDHAPG